MHAWSLFLVARGYAQLIDWCHDNMAAYKVPTVVEFVAELPKSGSGKILWRQLQEREMAAS